MFYNKLQEINVLNLSLNKNIQILTRSFGFVGKKKIIHAWDQVKQIQFDNNCFFITL